MPVGNIRNRRTGRRPSPRTCGGLGRPPPSGVSFRTLLASCFGGFSRRSGADSGFFSYFRMYARPGAASTGAYVSAAANWLIALHPSLFAHDFKRIADAAISQQLASWCFVTHSRALIKHPRTHILLPRSSRSAYRPPTRPDRAVGSIVPRAALRRSPVWRRLRARFVWRKFRRFL